MNKFTITIALAALTMLSACSKSQKLGGDGPGPSEQQYTEDEQNNGRALFEAAKKGDRQSVGALLDKGAPVNYLYSASNGVRIGGLYFREKTFTPLMAAVISGHSDITALLLARGADLNVKNNVGLTALSFATSRVDVKMSRLLIDKGAVRNASAQDNGYAAGNAARWPQARVSSLNGQDNARAEILGYIQKGGARADMNVRFEQGFTPLMFAVEVNTPKNLVTRKLIAMGADVNAKSADGNSVLHLAVDAYLSNVNDNADYGPNSRLPDNSNVEILLRAKADPNAKNNQGYSVLAYARAKGTANTRVQNELVRLLQKFGAEE